MNEHEDIKSENDRLKQSLAWLLNRVSVKDKEVHLLCYQPSELEMSKSINELYKLSGASSLNG